MKTTPVIVLLSILAAWAWAALPAAAFDPDRLWPDDRGVPINARGGGLLSYQGVYYWFGQHMADGTTGEVAQVGVHVYSSTNLYHWKDEGIAMKVSDDPASDIAAGCVIEGPKVLHNPKTGKFVMWFHLEPKGSGHAAALAGVAVADRPTGPYRYRESFRLNAGKLPRTVTEASQIGGSDGPLIRDLAGGQMSGDMTLFADDDGTAYQIAVSEDNRTLHISRLTEDYLRTSGEYARAFPDAMYRSPVVFKRRGRYWMIASDGAGQAPGATRLATADSIWGTWTALGNPWVGVEEQVHAGFDARPADVLPLPDNMDAFIFMADRSQPDDGHEGRYVWLPIQFRADDSPFLQWLDRWDLGFFGPACPPSAQMADDGRGFSVTGPGILPFDAAFEATVEVDEQRRTLLSRNGTSSGPGGLSVEVTPFGSAQVTTASLHFEDERLDLHVRLSRLPGVPAVVVRVGIRNAGPRPIRLWSLTPLDADVQVVGDPSNWLVTPLDKSTESTASPAVALEDIRDPLKVHEYGGLYRQDGLGFLFGPVGEPVAYLKTTVTHGGNGKARVAVTADMSGVDVDPGETRWGQQAVLLFEPPRQALPRWAEWVAKTHGALTDKGALAGWCSWYHLTDRVAGKDVLGIVDAALGSKGRLRPDVIQIDDGYQDIDGEWDANAKFPEGLPFYAQRIAATGARPGLWMAMMLVCPDTPWVKDPANLAAVRGQKFDPPSGSRFRGSGWLDPTHPRAQEYIADRIRHAVRSGFTYLKLDFNNVGGGNWYEKKKTSFEIKRDYCTNIRQAAGEGTYILFCAPEPDRATVGLVDASRTGHDSWRGGVRSAMQDVLRSFQLNGHWFAVDNDCYYLATDVPDIGNIEGGWPLVKTWISMTGLSCGAAFTSDPWQWESFKPYWRTVEVLTPPAKERTEVLDLGTDRDWPRLVGMVKREWGTAAVALLWNPAAAEHNVKLDFAQAGLDPQREYAVWSFWDEEFLGFAKGSWTTPALPPGGSQHLRLTEVDRSRGAPALVGSSLHIYCGAAEIERFRAERTEVEIDLTDAGARAGNLFVYSPARLVLRNASGCSVGAIERVGEDVWRIPVAQRQPGRPQRIGLAIAVPLAQQPHFWALTGMAALGAGFGIWWYVQRQRTRLALARVEHRHAMERERVRIARDIHDDLGASLTHIALLSEMAQADAEDPRATRTHVDEIFHTAHTLTRAVDEIVWAVNPANDTIEKFAAFIGPFAQRFLSSAGVSCHIELPDELPPTPMPAAARHQLFLAIKEALRNVVSHAGARAVRLAFSLEGERLTLIVADDGRGFDLQSARGRPGGGHGLANMEQRMAALGGSLDVQSAPGKGATVTMRLKLDQGTRP